MTAREAIKQADALRPNCIEAGAKAIGITNFYISTLDFLGYLLYNIIE